MRLQVEEETGYRIPPTALHPLVSTREAVGLVGNSLVLYYAEVDDSMRVRDAGHALHVNRMHLLHGSARPPLPSRRACFWWAAAAADWQRWRTCE
ncbi:hypothetical protein EON66_01010 [archaeon]|nr:MAG: hypothetical protein EON66_01010 [archaeon]